MLAVGESWASGSIWSIWSPASSSNAHSSTPKGQREDKQREVVISGMEVKNLLWDEW